MNRKAQIPIYGLMLGITIMILGLALATATFESTNTARGNSTANFIGLNCDNTNLSTFDQGTCLFVDFSGFYFLAAVIFIGGAVVTAKIVFG